VISPLHLGLFALLGATSSLIPCGAVYQLAAAFAVLGGGSRGHLWRAGAYLAARGAAHGLMGLAISALGALSLPILLVQRAAGPLLILSSCAMLKALPWLDMRPLAERGARAAGSGHLGAAAAGILLSLVPCPEGAAALFGAVIPQAASMGPVGALLGAMAFGLGSGLPPVLMAAGLRLLPPGLEGWIARREGKIRTWAAMGIMGIGLYMTMAHVYHLF